MPPRQPLKALASGALLAALLCGCGQKGALMLPTPAAPAAATPATPAAASAPGTR